MGIAHGIKKEGYFFRKESKARLSIYFYLAPNSFFSSLKGGKKKDPD